MRVIPGNTAEIPRFEIKGIKEDEDGEEEEKCSDEDKSDHDASACEESDELIDEPIDCIDIAMAME